MAQLGLVNLSSSILRQDTFNGQGIQLGFYDENSPGGRAVLQKPGSLGHI